jgi:flagellar biosynthesis protein FlhF
MNTQTFRAHNIAAALEEVKRQIGPEAIVVSVRKVPPGRLWQAWRSPEIEVVAMAPSKGASRLMGVINRPAEMDVSATRPSDDVTQQKPPSNIDKSQIAELTQLIKKARKQLNSEDAIEENQSSSSADSSKSAIPSKTVVKIPSRKLFNTPTKIGIPLTSNTSVKDPSLEIAENEVETLTENLPEGLKAWLDKLLAQGVDETIARKVMEVCARSLSPQSLQDEKRLHDYLSLQLQACLRTYPSTELTTKSVICLIGPGGAGKTNACAKIAAFHNRGKVGQRVAWICADTVSAGAISQARIYTEALGIPLHLAYTPTELLSAVTEAQADLILVDTPGCNPYQESSLIELGDLLTALPERSVFLVSPATVKDSDLNRTVLAFKSFKLDGLVITRLDETRTYGNIFNLAWRSQLPLVYLSNGPRVPDDLQVAHPAQLVSALLGDNWSR